MAARKARRIVLGTAAWIAIVAVVNLFVDVHGPSAVSQPTPKPSTTMAKPLSPSLFQLWPANRKPDVVLILTGQQHSYLKFCGCTENQLGGFERRYNFMLKLRERGWPVVGVDLGDLAEHKNGVPAEQTVLKYDAAIRSLAAMQYSALGVGELDFRLPLVAGLSNNVLQNAAAYPTLLCANLNNRDVQFPNLMSSVTFAGGQNGVPKIGIGGVVGPAVDQRSAAADVTFSPQNVAIADILKSMDANKAEIRILLYQGDHPAALKVAGAPDFNKQVDPTFADKFDVILCLCAEEEPPGKQDGDIVGRTSVVRVGHRGRYIGMMGLFRTNQPALPWDKQFQIVEMSEEYETDKDKEAANPILSILQEYAKEVKAQNFVTQVAQVKHPVAVQFPNEKVTFVGSERCKGCHAHPKEFNIWHAEIVGSKKKHSHAKAFEALGEKYAKKPTLRQFDPECVVCHTVGYGFESGYRGEADARFKNVGCENCHGPGSLHVANPNNPAYWGSLSPWKANKDDLLPSPDRLQLGFNALTPQEQRISKNVNDLCQKCHDTDNDPTFKFETFWPRIRHGRGTEPVIPKKAN